MANDQEDQIHLAILASDGVCSVSTEFWGLWHVLLSISGKNFHGLGSFDDVLDAILGGEEEVKGTLNVAAELEKMGVAFPKHQFETEDENQQLSGMLESEIWLEVGPPSCD